MSESLSSSQVTRTKHALSHPNGALTLCPHTRTVEEEEDPANRAVARRARSGVAAELCELHQRVYSSEAMLADKHGEILSCYAQVGSEARRSLWRARS